MDLESTLYIILNIIQPKVTLSKKKNILNISNIYWVVPKVIADFFIQIKDIFLNTRNKL